MCNSNINCYYTMKEIPIRSINLVASTPMVKTDNGQLVGLVDTLKIVYYENLVLFQIPYFDQLVNIITGKSGNVIGEKLIKDELRYKLFIYRKGSNYGFIYDSLNAKDSQKLLVDSFLSDRTFQSMEIFSRFYKNSNDSLIETSTDSKNGSLTEKYLTKVKYDESYNDTSYLYYTNELNGIDFSFSKELDSIKNMKLFKIRFIYNLLQTNKYSFAIPKREFLFEIRETPVSNRREIIDFIMRFKNSVNNKI